MSSKIGISILAALATACTWAGSDTETKATHVERTVSPFEDVRISMRGPKPVRFVLHFVRDMPTPGWTFDIDEVSVDAETKRIVIRATEKRPDGIVVQVISPAEMTVELGALDPGRYVLECWTRRGTERPYGLTDAMVVSAR
ncbi:MAG: hypothetical protein GY716_16340 [bacterium]|nr:hypothetical protein [bacterium]